MRYLTITILLAVFNICFAFNPSSGFLDKPIQRDTEVEFNYVSTYNGLNMTATSPYYIEMSNNEPTITSGNEICWEFWIKVDSLNKSNPLFEAIVNDTTTSTLNGCLIQITDSNKVNFSIYNDSLAWQINSVLSLSDTAWYYIVLNQKPMEGLEIFINGVYDCSDTFPYRFRYKVTNKGAIIGKSNIESSFFIGKIAEFSYLHKNLDSTQIFSNFENDCYFLNSLYPQYLYHFEMIDSIITDYGKYNADGIFVGNADSLNNAFFSDTPNFYEWDINADGEYDTTTTEPTLVYNYGTYDTTQVIVKAVFDSLDFNVDTTDVAMYNNLLSLVFDTLWVCTLETSLANVADISDSGDIAIVNVNPTGIRGFSNTYIIDHGNVSFFDSTAKGWILNDGENFLLRKLTYHEYYNSFYHSGFLYIDSTGIINEESGLGRYSYVSDETDYLIAFLGTKSNVMHIIGDETITNDVLTMSTDLTEVNSIISDTSLSYVRMEYLAHSKKLNFIAKLLMDQPILIVYDKYGDTLYTRNDVYNFDPDTTRFLGSLIYVDDEDYIYTLIGYSFNTYGTYTFFDDEMNNGFNLMINKYDSTGFLHRSDTLDNVKTGILEITDDGKYMIGCSETGLATKQIIALWDLQTNTQLFEYKFDNSIDDTYISFKYFYHEETDNLLIHVFLEDEKYIFDKYGNQLNDESNIKIIKDNPNFGYEQDGDRLIMYKVEWE